MDRSIIAIVTALAMFLATPVVTARSNPPEATEDRVRVFGQLVDLGWTEVDAASAIAQLTPDDLAVFAENPAMMQRAGASNQVMLSIFVAALIIGALVAIAIASDSSTVMINSP